LKRDSPPVGSRIPLGTVHKRRRNCYVSIDIRELVDGISLFGIEDRSASTEARLLQMRLPEASRRSDSDYGTALQTRETCVEGHVIISVKPAQTCLSAAIGDLNSRNLRCGSFARFLHTTESVASVVMFAPDPVSKGSESAQTGLYRHHAHHRGRESSHFNSISRPASKECHDIDFPRVSVARSGKRRSRNYMIQ